MGNPIHRSRGKRGAPDVTRNLGTNKTTVTHRDPRKAGSLGSRVTKSYSNGKTKRTETWNYGDGVTKRTTSTLYNVSSNAWSSVTRTRKGRRRSSKQQGDIYTVLALGLLSVVLWIAVIAVMYWYITIPLIAAYFYYRQKKKKEQQRIDALPTIASDNKPDTGQYKYTGTQLAPDYEEWKRKNNLES